MTWPFPSKNLQSGLAAAAAFERLKKIEPSLPREGRRVGETQLGFLLQIKGISFYLLAKFQQTRRPPESVSPAALEQHDRGAHSDWCVLGRIRMIKPGWSLGPTGKRQEVIAVAADEDQSLRTNVAKDLFECPAASVMMKLVCLSCRHTICLVRLISRGEKTPSKHPPVRARVRVSKRGQFP